MAVINPGESVSGMDVHDVVVKVRDDCEVAEHGCKYQVIVGSGLMLELDEYEECVEADGKWLWMKRSGETVGMMRMGRVVCKRW